MTTSIIIEACVSDDKRVCVTTKENGVEEVTYLKNGEKFERCIWDDIEVSAKEEMDPDKPEGE